MNETQIEAIRFLVEFARTVQYSDGRFAPKDLHKACDFVEEYLDEIFIG